MSTQREGLNEKGQLLPGYRFIKGGKVVKIKTAKKSTPAKRSKSAVAERSRSKSLMQRRRERLAKRRK